MRTDWSRLGDSAAAEFDLHHEQLVAHFVRLVQQDADHARAALKQYLSGELVPSPATGLCTCPDMGIRVKSRMDELGITPAPRSQTPWFLEQPDNQGWRFKPFDQ